MYLNCHSFHSLRYGTISLDELVLQAKVYNITSLALTDINTITGIYDFAKACKKEGIKPIAGMEFRDDDNRLLYITLAKQRSGIAEICRLLTARNCDEIALPLTAPAFQQVITIYPTSNVPQQLQKNEYIGIRPDQLNILIRSEWKQRMDKLVILQPVTVSGKTEH
ncbi:MAG: PHP domain-containing protein, partial [Sphingobacterium sp.]